MKNLIDTIKLFRSAYTTFIYQISYWVLYSCLTGNSEMYYIPAVSLMIGSIHDAIQP